PTHVPQTPPLPFWLFDLIIVIPTSFSSLPLLSSHTPNISQHLHHSKSSEITEWVQCTPSVSYNLHHNLFSLHGFLFPLSGTTVEIQRDKGFRPPHPTLAARVPASVRSIVLIDQVTNSDVRIPKMKLVERSGRKFGRTFAWKPRQQRKNPEPTKIGVVKRWIPSAKKQDLEAKQGTSYIDKLGFASFTVWNMRTWKP
ncbi:hypothetical protein M8C21_007947, partial [Ambrosia artemisiifolia]